jgi:hypothetical protein
MPFAGNFQFAHGEDSRLLTIVRSPGETDSVNSQRLTFFVLGCVCFHETLEPRT